MKKNFLSARKSLNEFNGSLRARFTSAIHVCVCLYVYMCMCMCVCLCVCVCIYIYIYICMYVCIYIYTYIYMYIHTNIHACIHTHAWACVQLIKLSGHFCNLINCKCMHPQHGTFHHISSILSPSWCCFAEAFGGRKLKYGGKSQHGGARILKPRWVGTRKPRWVGTRKPRWVGTRKPRWVGTRKPRWVEFSDWDSDLRLSLRLDYHAIISIN